MSKVLTKQSVRGLKVLSFIEWCNKKRHTVISEIKFVDVLDFYNQKFDVGMLVNPYQKYQTTEGKCLLESSDEWASYSNIVNPEWQQAEQNRLFEGFEKVRNCYTLKSVHVICTKEGYCLGSSKTPHTLNDFITLCNLAGIELQWNTNNQTIKNLFS